MPDKHPDPAHLAALSQRIASICRKPVIKIAFVTYGYAANFDLASLAEMEDRTLKVRGYSGKDLDASCGPHLDADVLVNACNVHIAESAFLNRARAARPQQVVVSWMFDNHHDELTNLHIALASDLVFPSHGFCRTYLNNPRSVLAESLPLCCTQWGELAAADLYQRFGAGPRANELYGGFVAHDVADRRNRRVRDAMHEVPEHRIRLFSGAEALEYYGLSPADRFQQWASYKVSFNPAVRQDLSTRVFDSLIAGLIPIVPDTTLDLDAVIPPSEQHALPVVRYCEEADGAVVAAWREGLRRYDADGQAGADHRHRYALRHHTLPTRLRRIVDTLRDIASERLQFSVGVHDQYEGWYGVQTIRI